MLQLLTENMVPVLPMVEMSGAEKILVLYATSYQDRLVVVSESARLLEKAEAMGCIPVKGSVKGDNGPYPPGGLKSLGLIAGDARFAGRDFIVFNQEMLPPSTDGLEHALKQFGEEDTFHLLPMLESEDHPCQFRSYYTILGVKAVHLLSGDKTAKGKVSREYPCFLEAPPKRGIWFGRDSSSYPPKWREKATDYLVFQASPERDTAVVAFHTPDGVPAVEGAAINAAGEAVYPYVFKGQDSEAYLFQFDPALKSGNQYTAWIVPFSSETIHWEQGVEKVFSNASNPIPIQVQSMAGMEVSGFIVMLLMQAEFGGSYDFDMGLRGGDIFDLALKRQSGNLIVRTVDSQTGKLISGRQLFPEILEPYKGFAVFSGRNVEGATLESLLANTRPCVLEPGLCADKDKEAVLHSFMQSRKWTEKSGQQRGRKEVDDGAPQRGGDAICCDLMEVDRVIDILSSKTASESGDEIFRYFCGLAIELMNRRLAWELQAHGAGSERS